MKIAIVSDAWHPQINGVVTTYQNTIDELCRLGHQVLTISPEMFTTIPCPTYPEIPLSLARPARLEMMLARFAPHAIHIATEGPLGWAARRACLRHNRAFTTAYHTRFPEYLRLRFPVPLRFSYGVVRHFHKKARRVMVATEALKKELETRGFRRVSLWSRGVDTTIFRPEAAVHARSDQPLYTYVGRIAPEKNIEAFLRLDLPGEKCVVGDGPALPELRRRYPDVVFTGYRQGRALAALIAASSVFVFPSLTDTFGIVQLEAMACGVPVAAFPADGPRSVIENGRNGWLDHDLKAAISNCLSIDRRHCRQFALKHSWQACTRQFLDNLSLLDPLPAETSITAGTCSDSLSETFLRIPLAP